MKQKTNEKKVNYLYHFLGITWWYNRRSLIVYNLTLQNILSRLNRSSSFLEQSLWVSLLVESFVCFQGWLMSSLFCSSSFSSNHSICSLKKTRVQVEDIPWLAIDKKEKWLGDIKDLSEPSQNIGLSFDSFFCNCLKRMKWERLMLITLNQNTKEIAPYFTFSIKTKIHYLAPNENIKNMQIQNVYACITIGHKNLPFF